MKRVLALTLLACSVYSTGCAQISQQVKDIAMASAEKAATAAISQGKLAMEDLGSKAEARVRDLGSDLYSAVKTEVEAGGSQAAQKAAEVAVRHFKEVAPAPVSSLVEDRVNAALQARGLLDEHGARVGKPDDELTFFEQIMLAIGGTAGTAVTGVAASQMSKNSHDKKIVRKQYEQELLAKAPA